MPEHGVSLACIFPDKARENLYSGIFYTVNHMHFFTCFVPSSRFISMFPITLRQKLKGSDKASLFIQVINLLAAKTSAVSSFLATISFLKKIRTVDTELTKIFNSDNKTNN